jgi:endoglucanase
MQGHHSRSIEMPQPTTPRRPLTRPVWVLLFTVLACLFAFAGPARAELAIHVHGNQLVDAEGRAIRLLGVNFSGAEYSCIQDRGIWSAPTDQAAIEAMQAWHIDVVRIPLNEDCWLGINGAPAEYSGGAYQQAIHEFVQTLHEDGLYAILDLQWSAPGANQATGLQQMADADHSVEFWSSVAHSFRADPAVLFDLYSEPHEISWECWLEGCTLPWQGGGTWQTAGMQSLVDAVRAQGATQPLLLGGIEWANELSEWLIHVPSDPENQLVASVHVYPNNTCNSPGCWSSTLTPIASRYPVLAGEIGEFDCEDHFIDQFMNWSDANDVSYLGWAWNTFDCSSGPALIADTNGTPTAFGQGLYERLRTPRTTLGVSPSPAQANRSVTLTVQVSSPTATAAPTGSVTFQIDGESVATQSLDDTGQAALSLSRLSVGTHKLRAFYGGDETLIAGTSEAQTIDVLPEPSPTKPASTSQAQPASPPAVAPGAALAPSATAEQPSKPAKPAVRRTAKRKHGKSIRDATRELCSRASRTRSRDARAHQLRLRCAKARAQAKRATLRGRNETAIRKR